MDIKLLITKNNQVWDLTNAVESLSISYNLYDQPGVLEFTILDNSDYPNGSVVDLTIDNKGVFKGRVFETSVNGDGHTSITAYDGLRYFKNEDIIYYENLTVDGIFLDINARLNLVAKIKDNCPFIPMPEMHKKSMFAIFNSVFQQLLINQGLNFMIRDNYGITELCNIANQKTSLIIGTESLLTGFEHSKSIEDSFNVVKLWRDNDSTMQRDVWQEQDSENLLKWGKLQYTQEVDAEASEEYIKNTASLLLEVLNRERQSLSLSITTTDFINLKAGDGIKVQIEGLVDEWFYLESVDMNISEGVIEMDMEVYLP